MTNHQPTAKEIAEQLLDMAKKSMECKRIDDDAVTEFGDHCEYNPELVVQICQRLLELESDNEKLLNWSLLNEKASLDFHKNGDLLTEEINALKSELKAAKARSEKLFEGFKKLRDTIELGPFFGELATNCVQEADLILRESDKRGEGEKMPKIETVCPCCGVKPDSDKDCECN